MENVFRIELQKELERLLHVSTATIRLDLASTLGETMTRDESKIKDWRSTGRRKARRELYNAFVPYECVDCGKSTKEPPKDAPKHFEDIWPEENRVLESQLQADHESKDYTNNELDYINWRCVSCHQRIDSTTAKGVPTKSVNYW